MPGLDAHDLVRLEVIFHGITVEFCKCDAGPGEFLKHEALPSQQPGAESAIEKNIEGHLFFRAQERMLVQDDGLAHIQFDGQNLAGKISSERHLSRPALRAEINDEYRATRDRAPHHTTQSASG